MIVCGCDVGSLTAKAVLMEGDRVVASAVIRALARPSQSAEAVLRAALESAGLPDGSIASIVGTGYGRRQIPFVDHVESEIACHARGARWQLPTVRTVIDIGGQDAKAIRIDEKGNLGRYVYNDKCASGTGRFLEVMAEALDLKLEEMGEIARGAKEKVVLSNQCVVFAETEIISLVNDGREVAGIVSGLHHSLAGRVAALARSIGIEREVVLTGGVAKNGGVARALEEALATPVRLLDFDPQLNGALGAALLATETAARRGGARAQA